MGSLIDIRRRIKSTKNTAQITKAMKMVSASRLRRASERAVAARPYAERLFDVHRSILARMTELEGELYTPGDGTQTLMVLVGGDKGLCGSFNANVFKGAERLVSKAGASNVDILPIGNKAIQQARKMGCTVLNTSFGGVFRDISVALAEEITEMCVEYFLSGKYNRVVMVFNKFKNVLVQEVTEWQVLPLADEGGEVESQGAEHLAEPSLEEILDDLSPRVVMTRIYQALLESCAAEHAARMTAMDAATNNAKDMIEQLTLEMNKARQAAITTELIEVVSGAAAL